MHSKYSGKIIEVGFAIFAMLFGVGNLMFPLKVGILSGDKFFWGISGFILAGVLLPFLSLGAIIVFDGDYNSFFARVGKNFGKILIFFCMLVIGPFIAMPRILMLSYEMMQPFLPQMPVWLFSLIFLFLVFLATFKPNNLLGLIGKLLSPLKIASLLIIIFLGIYYGTLIRDLPVTQMDLFSAGIKYGYGTLDVLGAIFFGSIIVRLLGKNSEQLSTKQQFKIVASASILAGVLLSFVYIGMGYLGACFGKGLLSLNEGQLFSVISFRILGPYGAALIGFTIFLTCFITAISLAVVVTDYIRIDILSRKFSYSNILIGVLFFTLIPASFGLGAILKFSVPIIEILYPVIVILALCNAMYKAFGFSYIKIPVYFMLGIGLIKTAFSLALYYFAEKFLGSIWDLVKNSVKKFF